uniref:Uncharacterized protein n=1 Tax=Peronospora matthiolae TaxID=2874970 RepID=A0AAV1U7U7_9STRA
MYSGKVNINCSPPLGTDGYYSSLRHAKQLVQKVIVSQTDSPTAYRSGDSFHDCIRLVLAKVSTLDWTTVDNTLQQLQIKNLLRRLPGVIRTGCLMSADFYTKDSVPKCVVQPAVSSEKENALLRFEVLVEDHPKWLQCWPDAGTESAFDSIEDTSIDFGPSVCDLDGASDEGIHFVLVELFQRYLHLSFKDATEKITADDFAHFDILLSFLVHRRKHKVALWMKEYLGPDQFVDAWNEIEQSYLAPFEALLQRCTHQCAKCQLQCMRSTLHASDKEHDCGLATKANASVEREITHAVACVAFRLLQTARSTVS